MEKKFTPYDTEHDLVDLVLVTCVVPASSERYFREILHEHEAFIVVSSHGYGTSAPNSVGEVLGLNTHTKQALFAVLKKSKWASFKKLAKERIETSEYTKGIALCTPIDGVAGVSTYKMFANIQKFDKPKSILKVLKGEKHAKRKK